MVGEVNFAFRRRPAFFAAAAALSLAAPSLTACNPMDVFGPKPDPVLVSLAQQAHADAAVDGADAALRAEQAKELDAEIARLCGQTPEGQTPGTCIVDEPATPLDAKALGPELIDEYLAALDTAPESSRELLIVQAIELVVAGAKPNVSAPSSTDDLVLARSILSAEHATVYALEASRAFIEGSDAFDALLASHETRILTLSALIPDAPESAPGYSFPHSVPGPQLISEAEDSVLHTWVEAAVNAQDPAFFIAGAGGVAQAIQAYDPSFSFTTETISA